MTGHWIDGAWVESSAAGELEIINPATEEVLDRVPRGGSSEVEAAVVAARRAYDAWSRLPAGERAGWLHGAAQAIRDQHQQLVRLLTLEEGKPVPENEEELLWVEETFDYYAELGRHQRGRVIPSADPAQLNFTLHQPYGVVGCIVPWNYPLLLMVWKVAPALAAGNTVVIKPSKFTPLSSIKLVETAFSKWPRGVVNLVTGLGTEAGESLVRHPEVPVIAFTGSLAIGQRIASLGAPMMKKLHLELGGKDPMVIGPDMDIDLAVKALAYAGLINAGQVCTGTERVYVAESRYAQFSESLADFVSGLRLGPGIEPGTDVGPMLRPAFRDRVENHVAQAVGAGAKILTGGKRPAEFKRGFFYEPTVLIGVNHQMDIMREETFGPVLPLMPYKDLDQAIVLANDSPYGLGASLMSHDPRWVKRFYEEVQAGTIWINDPLTDNYAGPFGGMKMSGQGRELGEEGLTEFLQVKHVHWDMFGEIKGYWYPYD
jgi:acyl-CoA reductase-like NAD-dependent aldehyde dehydrogenase